MTAPNIKQYFPHLREHVEPGLGFGKPLLSDFADKSPDDPVFGIYRQCGFLFPEEANILYQCASQLGGVWLDIGAHTGWTAIHLAVGGAIVGAIDPMYANEEFYHRALQNAERAGVDMWISFCPFTSRRYFANRSQTLFDGVMIDGDHFPGEPEFDAEQAFQRLKPRGAILLHDFVGGPVQRATAYLMRQGMKGRVYWSSSQLLALCWRGDFVPPEHTPDPSIDWTEYKSRIKAFPFEACV